MGFKRVVAFFFKARPPASQRQPSDPEKGREPEPVPEAHRNDEDFIDEGLPTGTTLVQDDNTSGTENDDEDGDRMVIDEDVDENAIIREVEREEYPEEETTERQGRRHEASSSFSTSITGTVPSTFSRSWSKFKAFLNTSTSLEDLESYVPQYRYLPILSGIIIPFSILLEIPGLTEDWYIRTVDNKVAESKSNPLILELGLAFSLACAVIANICLFLRFLEKKIKAMTVLCVIFLTIHDLINIAAVTVFGVKHPIQDGFTYGQAFWMIVCSTSVSSFVNVTLIVDLIRTQDFSKSGSGLTRKQRSLVLSVMVLLCYIAFGAVVQTFLIDGLTFINALYFTVVTIETIGFGDIFPTSTGGRVFTCLFSTFGIVSLAVTVTLTRETVLEALEISYRKRVRAVRLSRKQAHRKKRIAERWRAAIEFRLRESGLPIWVRDDPEVHQHRRCMKMVYAIWPWSRGHPRYAHSFGIGSRMQPHGMHLNLEVLSCAQLETAALEAGVPLCRLLPPGFKMPAPRHQDEIHTARVEEIEPAGSGTSMPRFFSTQPVGLPLTHARIGRMAAMLTTLAFAVTERSFARVQTADLPPKETAADDESSINMPYVWSIAEQYESMRAGMAVEEKRAFAARLFVVWTFFIAFWMVGSGIFSVTEGWSFGISMYSCFIAFTTIGFGDFAPKTPAGRAVFVFWALLGVGTVTILISILSEAYSYRYKRSIHTSILSQAVKRYRENSQTISEQSRVKRAQSISQVHESLQDAPLESQQRVAGQLEALPHEVLRQVRTFNENVQYLMKPDVLADKNETLPGGLKRLLDDVAGKERLGDRIKQEILRDKDARRTLLSVSIEDALRQMIDLAEDALHSLHERDRINAHLSRQNTQDDQNDIQKPHSHETDEPAA